MKKVEAPAIAWRIGIREGVSKAERDFLLKGKK